MRRILIVGASGFLGSHLAVSLRDTFRVFGTFHRRRPRLDRVPCVPFSLAPGVSLAPLLDRLTPDAVLYCAGVSDVKPCQEDPLGALHINAEAPAALAALAEARGIRLVYFSTPKVFPGDQGKYREDSLTGPQSVYGKTKLRGEELLKAYDGVCVLRLGTVFGMGTAGGKSILNDVLRSLHERKEMRLISDELRSFYGVENVVRAVRLLLGSDSAFTGLYHLSHGRAESYYAFGKAVAEAFDLPSDCLVPVSGAHSPSPEPRGRDTSILGNTFSRRFGWEVSSVADSLTALRQKLRAGNQ